MLKVSPQTAEEWLDGQSGHTVSALVRLVDAKTYGDLRAQEEREKLRDYVRRVVEVIDVTLNHTDDGCAFCELREKGERLLKEGRDGAG